MGAFSRMECGITDGPQEDDCTKQDVDEDRAYENHRQQKIDDGECMTCNNQHMLDSPYCEDCYDPTPWCHGCGASDSDQCNCGDYADNR